MAVRFVLGRAGSGKTELVLRELLDALEREDDTARLILLVPEQATFQMQRALVSRSPRRGFWRAEVLSFSRLAGRVFTELGRQPPLLTPQARLLALHALLNERPELAEPFGAAGRTPGFVAQLDAVISEFVLAGLEPDAIRDKAAALDDPARRRLEALAAVHDAFRDWLGSRLDPQQQLEALRDCFSELPWLAGSHWWIDGFAGFTEQELATLVQIATRARDVTISLLVDPAAARQTARPQAAIDPLNLFARTLGTYRRLLELLRSSGVTLADPVELAPGPLPRFERAELRALEAGLASAGAETLSEIEPDPTEPPAVRIMPCTTHRDELRQAARWIRAQVQQSAGRLRFRDFAVIVRDLEPLAEQVEEVFGEYGIPYFLDRRRSIRSHALSRLIDATLELIAEDFSLPAARRWLATGLLPMRDDQAELLDLLLACGPLEGRQRWQQPGWGVEDLRRLSGLSEQQLAGLDRQRERLVAALEPLLKLAPDDEPSRPAAARDWAEALYETLRRLRADRRIAAWVRHAQRHADRLTAEVHRLTWDAVCQVLDDLHEVLGDTPVSLAALGELLRGALESRSVAMPPPTLDQVLVGSIERSRHPEIRCVWVAAFNDQHFPRPLRDDPLIGAADRQRLAGLGLHGLRNPRQELFDERLLAYIALTRPSEQLVISYATVGDDGEVLLPSPYLADVRAALPWLRPERPPRDTPPVCLPELARGLLARQVPAVGMPPSDAARWRVLAERIATDAEARDTLAWLMRGRTLPRAGQPVVLSDPPIPKRLSPSQVNRLLNCPFQHFALSRLGLEEYAGPPPLRTSLGRVGHSVLASVTQQAIDAGWKLEAIGLEQWQQWFDEALGQALRDEAPLLGEPPRERFVLDSFRVSLWGALQAQIQRWKAGVFAPVAVELPLEAEPSDGALPGPCVTLDGRELRLTGFVDRLDVAELDGRRWVLVCDYKPAAQKVRGEYLTGYPLQIFIYLWAVLEAGDEDTRPAGVLIVPLWPDTKAIDSQAFRQADADEQRLRLYRPHGVLAEAIAEALDPELRADGAHSRMYPMRRTKDGPFYANDPVVGCDELNAYAKLARLTVTSAAKTLVCGDISVRPLVEKRTLACQHCPLQTVCRFERDPHSIRNAEKHLPKLEEVLSEGAGGSDADGTARSSQQENAR